MTERMRRPWPLLVVLLAALAVAADAGPAPAQEAVEAPVPPAERGWIGISFEYDLRCDGCPADESEAVLVKRVFEGSPADRAGLEAGDRIVRIDGEPTDPERFRRFGARLRPGQAIRFTVDRDGERRRLEVVTDERPSFAEGPPLPPQVEAHMDSVRSALFRHMDSLRDRLRADPLRDRLRGLQEELVRTWREEREIAARAAAEERELDAEEGRRIEALRRRADSLEATLEDLYRQMAERRTQAAARALERAQLERVRAEARRERVAPPRPPTPLILGRDYVAGARVTELNTGLSEYFGVDRGVLVTEVLERGPAREAGLRPGDVIVSVAGGTPTSVEDLRRRLVRAEEWPVALTVVRKGEEVELRLSR